MQSFDDCKQLFGRITLDREGQWRAEWSDERVNDGSGRGFAFAGNNGDFAIAQPHGCAGRINAEFLNKMAGQAGIDGFTAIDEQPAQ